MKRTPTRTLAEVIREILRDSPAGYKLKEMELIRSWEEIVGKAIAGKTTRLYIKNRKLFAEINSSVVRGELMMMRSELKDALNKKAGEDLITEIVLK